MMCIVFNIYSSHFRSTYGLLLTAIHRTKMFFTGFSVITKMFL